MSNSFMRVDEVARELDVSNSYAYKVIKTLNKEMETKGFHIISGRVNRKFFQEKMCYGEGGN